ncbi:MAG TPA: hypothetical protein VFE05_03125 [Longimicrobiaceae bacterium]|nr:hypothetical protein [Longimicrobiaceae bacterium]
MFLRRSRSALLLLAAAVIAGCSGDSGTNSKTEGGTYAAATVTIVENGVSRQASMPAVLYDGPATAGGQTYNVRYELLSATLTLTEQGTTYSFTGNYRLTEKDGKLPVDNEVTTEHGNYILIGQDISFVNALDSDIAIDASGTLRNGTLSVALYDPIFDELNTVTFKR